MEHHEIHNFHIFSHINRCTSYKKPSRIARRPAPPPPPPFASTAGEGKTREAKAAVHWSEAHDEVEEEGEEEEDERPVTPPPRRYLPTETHSQNVWTALYSVRHSIFSELHVLYLYSCMCVCVRDRRMAGTPSE